MQKRFYEFFKLVKMDIMACNVQKIVFIHITDENVGLHATVPKKNVILFLAVSDLLKVYHFQIYTYSTVHV